MAYVVKLTINSSPLVDLTVYSSKSAGITSDFTGNLLETSVASFGRFPDNLSLMYHTVPSNGSLRTIQPNDILKNLFFKTKILDADWYSY